MLHTKTSDKKFYSAEPFIISKKENHKKIDKPGW